MTKKITRESQYKHTKSGEQEKDQVQEIQMTAKDGQNESHPKETKENHQDTDHHQKDMENRRNQKDMERKHQKEK